MNRQQALARANEILAERLALAGDRPPPDWDLTERQIQIIHGVALGLSNAEIAERLWVTSNTVKTHLQLISQQTHVGDRAGLVAHAFRLKLLKWDGDELLYYAPTRSRRRRAGLRVAPAVR